MLVQWSLMRDRTTRIDATKGSSSGINSSTSLGAAPTILHRAKNCIDGWWRARIKRATRSFRHPVTGCVPRKQTNSSHPFTTSLPNEFAQLDMRCVTMSSAAANESGMATRHIRLRAKHPPHPPLHLHTRWHARGPGGRTHDSEGGIVERNLGSICVNHAIELGLH